MVQNYINSTTFLGVCQDFKHFGFTVSVIILNEQGNKVVRALRKEACYVRFAPANKERVERLLLSLEKMRDDTLSILLPLLANTEAWATSDPCQYWSQTLYPWLDLPRKLGSTDHVWQTFQAIHEKQVAIEERLANDFFSCELLATLRQAELLGEF